MASQYTRSLRLSEYLFSRLADGVKEEVGDAFGGARSARDGKPDFTIK